MDHDEHLAHHDEQIRHLIALNVKMVEATGGINKSLAVVTELRERARADDRRNGH